jgi:hypothetical protein
MTRRTRLFVLVSASVLIGGVGTGLIASYLGLQSLTFGSDGPEELAYIPGDAALVAFADVRHVMDSELGRRFQQVRPGGRLNDGRDVLARSGINIETDVDMVVAALPPGGTSNRPPLVLARGRFDQARIEELVRGRDGQAEDYKGARLLISVEGDQRFALAFVEPGLAALGPVAEVRRAIDTKSGGNGSITGNAEMMALIRDVNAGDAWAAGRWDAMTASGRLPRGMAGQIPAITWFGATGHIGSGIEGALRADSATDEAATDLRKTVRGFISLARLQTRQQAALSTLIDSLQIGGEGRTVSLAFMVPADTIDALAALQGR